jgi:hypothetical protein
MEQVHLPLVNQIQINQAGASSFWSMTIHTVENIERALCWRQPFKETAMSSSSFTHKNRHLQHALLISGATAGIAGVLTFMVAGLVALVAGLFMGNPSAMFMPDHHIVPGLLLYGSLDTAAWLTLISAFNSLFIGLIAFVVVYGGVPAD